MSSPIIDVTIRINLLQSSQRDPVVIAQAIRETLAQGLSNRCGVAYGVPIEVIGWKAAAE